MTSFVETLAIPCVPSVPVRVALPTEGDVPVCSAPKLPLGPCPVCPRLEAEFEPYRQAAFWQSRHQRARQRETLLKEEVERLQAQLRLREQQLFGRKTDTTASPDTPPPTTGETPTTTKKPRGQQRGRPGPKRRDYAHLPAVVQEQELPAEQQRCPCCRLPFEPFPGTEDSAVLEIEVRAHRRVIRRHRYRPTCSCPQNRGIVTASVATKVIPKGILGVSILVELLLDNYLFYRPTYRLLADWKSRDLDLSRGTVTDALQRLGPLFEPVYKQLIEHNQKQKFWHGDETRWMVFATVEGKVGYRWFLWVVHSEEAVVFILDSGRVHDVPEKHLEPVKDGILVVDRYSAYKAMQQVKDGLIVLAFCWAHVRRDFLAVARSWPSEEEWTLEWVNRIGQLYAANAARVEVWESKPLEFAQQDAQLRQLVTAMAEQREQELSDPKLPVGRNSVLTSLREHWDGLTVFVEHPEVPMDNNRAERVQRGPVVLRKNSYGSGSVGAGKMAAMLFSLFQTLCLWNINPRAWLTAYLQACVSAGGKAPSDLGSFLPGQMDDQQREAWSLERKDEPDDSS